MEPLTTEELMVQGKAFKKMLVSLILQGEMQEFMKEEQEKWLWQGILRGKEEGVQEGLEEGLEKGHQVISDTLHRILIAKGFQVKPGLYQQFFDQLTLDDLEQLSEVALQVDSLAEFETALDALLQEK